MSTLIEESVITQKTRELCQTLLDQREVKALRQKIDTFMANDAVRGQYDALMMKGQMLHQKQHAGENLEEAEIAAFEKLRDGFLENPVARGFLDAQEEMQKLQRTVAGYVSKTFELGRVPEEADMEASGCCGGGSSGGGGGCGCSH